MQLVIQADTQEHHQIAIPVINRIIKVQQIRITYQKTIHKIVHFVIILQIGVMQTLITTNTISINGKSHSSSLCKLSYNRIHRNTNRLLFLSSTELSKSQQIQITYQKTIHKIAHFVIILQVGVMQTLITTNTISINRKSHSGSLCNLSYKRIHRNTIGLLFLSSTELPKHNRSKSLSRKLSARLYALS